jgi:hypothetical protein
VAVACLKGGAWNLILRKYVSFVLLIVVVVELQIFSF